MGYYQQQILEYLQDPERTIWEDGQGRDQRNRRNNRRPVNRPVARDARKNEAEEEESDEDIPLRSKRKPLRNVVNDDDEEDDEEEDQLMDDDLEEDATHVDAGEDGGPAEFDEKYAFIKTCFPPVLLTS